MNIESFPESAFPAKGALFVFSESPLCPDSKALRPSAVRAASVHAALRNAARGRSESGMGLDAQVLGLSSHGEGASVSVSSLEPAVMPLRTQRGLFCWVTSSAILQMVHDMLNAAGLTAPPQIPLTEGSELLCAPTSFCMEEGSIGIEEFRFAVKSEPLVVEWAEWLARFALPGSSALEWWQAKLRRDLVVLSDQLFRAMVSRCKVPVCHAPLGHPAWAFPENSLLVAKVGCESQDWPSIAGGLQQLKVLRLGSDRATGHGVCRTRWVV